MDNLTDGEAQLLEHMVRRVFFSLLLGQGARGYDLTETVIWMALGERTGGATLSYVAKKIHKDRATVRRRLRMMEGDGLVKQEGEIWSLVDAGFNGRSERFRENWSQLPEDVQQIFIAAMRDAIS